MAGIYALLRVLALSQVRTLRTLEASFTNHFVVFALLLFGLQPKGSLFLPVLIGFLLVLPLCTDPLQHAPRERLALLPLTRRQRLAVTGLALLFHPALWIAVLIRVLGGPGYLPAMELVLICGLLVLLTAALGRSLLARHPGWTLDQGVPRFPGRLGGLVQKNLRELLSGLDVFLAVILSLSATLYRLLTPGPTGEAGFGCALLVTLALSTRAQNLFGSEGAGGRERCRLLPLHGWELLLAKDAAFLLVVLTLTLPLDPRVGLAGGLAALAVNHFLSAEPGPAPSKWQFSPGGKSGSGFLQVLALFTAAVLCHQWPSGVLPLVFGLFLVSLAVGGRHLDTQLRP